MIGTGRLVVPALRWHDVHGFDGERDVVETALGFGAGGFCLFGGTADAVRELTSDLRARSRVPLLIASDVERGAGQQFQGATALPPLAALGSLSDTEVTRRAGRLTGREALALGVNWLLAPVADVALEPDNPIVGSRAFAAAASDVALHIAAWIEGAQAEGVLCCAKHFPGHGRTTEDSHSALPRVAADRDALALDLTPFEAAIRAGVGSIMTAHVVYDTLDASTAATLSSGILRRLLRDELGFDGIIVTDGLGMEGLRRAVPEGEAVAAGAALNAGCDMLLYPTDPSATARFLAGAGSSGLADGRVMEAIARVNAACARTRSRGEGPIGSREDAEWADAIAERACRVVRGEPGRGTTIQLLVIDEHGRIGSDAAQPIAFCETLAAAGVSVRTVAAPRRGDPLIVALYEGTRASRTMVRVTPAVTSAVEAALREVPNATIVVFGHADLCDRLPGRHLLTAWGGEPIMQRAAARRLASQAPA